MKIRENISLIITIITIFVMILTLTIYYCIFNIADEFIHSERFEYKIIGESVDADLCDGLSGKEDLSSSASKEDKIKEKICNIFKDNCELMIAIARAESGLDPNEPPNNNSNGSTDTGIFRINSIHGYDIEFLENIDNNIMIAKEIFDTQGITAWVAFNNESYLKFL